MLVFFLMTVVPFISNKDSRCFNKVFTKKVIYC